ncbi:MAG: D-amino-acid transaminase [Alphaproteobacteria bacterium]|nr:D-amino-acid transaminase [Alphaproteobacteria bacterium]
MSRVAYVNGRYVSHHQASVHIDDRGYQFADGVYEVMAVLGGQPVDEESHLDRLERSLSELHMQSAMARPPLRAVLREVIRRNRVRDGILYLQMTRGVARRDHPFPAKAVTSLVVTARPATLPPPETLRAGVHVITLPDIRWKRCDIKTISLLPNVLAKQQAREAGAFEAWLVDEDGFVTEGSATNAWIVTKTGVLVTRDAGQSILGGVTRLGVLQAARDEGITLEERPFHLKEAKDAAEAFLTSTTSFLLPVLKIDDTVIGGGKPGKLTDRLFHRYLKKLSTNKKRSTNKNEKKAAISTSNPV